LTLHLEQQLNTVSMRRPTAGWGNAIPCNYMSANKTTGLKGDKSNLKFPLQSNKVVPNHVDSRGWMAPGNKGDRSNDECYKCRRRGHFAITCPTREQRLTLLCEENTIEEETITHCELPFYHEGEVEENLEGSTLPICVIRRILTGQRAEDALDDDWLRTNIFHTRVEHNGKSLNLIIDKGSGMNVISQEAVQKLKILIEKHPKLYKVNWVDDTSILVRHRCLVIFSFGQCYKEVVWCDISPMRVCHILLGRPWLYDR